MSAELKYLLGPLAGPPPAPTIGSAPDHQAGLLDRSGAMQPIKIGGKKKKEEPVMIDLGVRNILADDEGTVEEEKDTQLVSRSEYNQI